MAGAARGVQRATRADADTRLVGLEFSGLQEWWPLGLILIGFDWLLGRRLPLLGALLASLIVAAPGSPLPEPLVAAFETVEPAGQVNIPIGNGRSHQYQLWRGLGFRGWPANRPVTARAELLTAKRS